MKLEQNEKIVLIIRKHPFYFILEVLVIIFLAVSPSLLISLWDWLLSTLPFVSSNPMITGELLPLGIKAFLYNLWLLFLWMVIIMRFTDFYLDKWVLTNKRLIDIEQKGFFAREVSSVRYEKIQDATVDVSGFIETILNFGTISIQTAGTEQEFSLPLAPDPLSKKEQIMKTKASFANHDHV